jgi:hypothetical protein
MSAETVLKDVRRLQRRSAFVSSVRAAEWAALFGVVLWYAYVFGLILEILPYLPFRWWYAAAVPLVLAVSGLVYGSLRRRSVTDVPVDADVSLGLKSRLSAAVQCIREKRQDPYAGAVFREYTRYRQMIKPPEVYPLRHVRSILLLPLLIAGALLITFGGVKRIDLPGSGVLADEGRTLEEFGRRMAVRAEVMSSPDSIALAEEIERLGRELQNETTSLDEGRRALQDMARRIDERVRGLGRSPAPAGSDPVLSEQLRDSLNRMLNNQMDSGEARELRQSLVESGSFTPEETEVLEQAFEPYERGDREASSGGSDFLRDLAGRDNRLRELEELLEDAVSQIEASEETLGGAGNGSPSGTAEDTRTPEEGESASSESSNDGGAERPRGPGDQDADGGDTGEKLVAGDPGTEEVDDVPGPATRFEEPEATELSEVQGTIANRRAVRTIVRNLPDLEDVDIEENVLDQSYIKQIEEAVADESIPESMKRYVKEYFLDIGVIETEQGAQQ